MSNSFYNTINLNSSALSLANQKAKALEDIIYDLFKERNKKMSPSEAWQVLRYRKVIKDNTPLTSCRRAITNLCTQGILEKTNDQNIGIYGAKEYYWRLKQKITNGTQSEMF